MLGFLDSFLQTFYRVIRMNRYSFLCNNSTGINFFLKCGSTTYLKQPISYSSAQGNLPQQAFSYQIWKNYKIGLEEKCGVADPNSPLQNAPPPKKNTCGGGGGFGSPTIAVLTSIPINRQLKISSLTTTKWTVQPLSLTPALRTSR